jgi:hypothetical protein
MNNCARSFDFQVAFCLMDNVVFGQVNRTSFICLLIPQSHINIVGQSQRTTTIQLIQKLHSLAGTTGHVNAREKPHALAVFFVFAPSEVQPSLDRRDSP